jgi:hypothetical protein
MKAYFDTAVLVAASVSDHPHHSQAIAALKMVRNKEIIDHRACEWPQSSRSICSPDPNSMYATNLSGRGMETAVREYAPFFPDRGSHASNVSRDDPRMFRGRMDRR